VRQIRKLREAGMSFRSIAAKFNRGQERIQRIVNGVSYKGVK
jgi:IS30 family transposase